MIQDAARLCVVAALALAAVPATGRADDLIPGVPGDAVVEGSDMWASDGVQAFELARDLEYQGIPCAGDHEVTLFLEQPYRLESCTLSRELSRGGVRYAAGHTITFHAARRIASGTLAVDQTVRGIPLRGGTAVHFHPDGRHIETCVVGDGATVRGMPLASGSELFLTVSGWPVRFTLDRPTRVVGVMAAAGPQVLLDGGLEPRLFLAEAATVRGIALPAGALVRFVHGTYDVARRDPPPIRALQVEEGSFVVPPALPATWAELYETGATEWVRLAAEATVGSRTFVAGTVLFFERDGHLVRAQPPEAAGAETPQ